MLGENVSSGFLDGYPDLLTVEHIAEITGLSKQTVRYRLQCGEIPGKHLGRRWYSPKAAFVRYWFEG